MMAYKQNVNVTQIILEILANLVSIILMVTEILTIIVIVKKGINNLLTISVMKAYVKKKK